MNAIGQNIENQDVFVKHECPCNGQTVTLILTLTLTNDLDFDIKERGLPKGICM